VTTDLIHMSLQKWGGEAGTKPAKKLTL